MASKITKDTKLVEVLNLVGANEILSKYHVPCITCPMAQIEMHILTLGKIALMYELNLEDMLEDLNKLKNE
jgi:hypothetical protein